MNVHLFIFREFAGDYDMHDDDLVVYYSKKDSAARKKEHLEIRYGLKSVIEGTNLKIKVSDIKNLPAKYDVKTTRVSKTKKRVKMDNEKERLLDNLQQQGYLKPKARRAMELIDRERFIPLKYRDQAYEDHPIQIGSGQTISAPHMYAMMTGAASIETKKRYKILEIGTGSGYQAAILAEILKMHGGGHVHTIERVPSLAKKSSALLNKLGYGSIVSVHLGNGSAGYKKEAPYDRILVTAGAPEIPIELFDQLKESGIMIIPAGKKRQILYKVVKTNGKPIYENLGDVSFVPLIGKRGWS